MRLYTTHHPFPFLSRQAVQRYQNEIAQLIHYGGTAKESAISGAFERLLNEYCRQQDFLPVPQPDYKAIKGKFLIKEPFAAYI